MNRILLILTLVLMIGGTVFHHHSVMRRQLLLSTIDTIPSKVPDTSFIPKPRPAPKPVKLHLVDYVYAPDSPVVLLEAKGKLKGYILKDFKVKFTIDVNHNDSIYSSELSFNFYTVRPTFYMMSKPLQTTGISYQYIMSVTQIVKGLNEAGYQPLSEKDPVPVLKASADIRRKGDIIQTWILLDPIVKELFPPKYFIGTLRKMK